MINTDYYVAIAQRIPMNQWVQYVTRQKIQYVFAGNYLLSPTWGLLQKAKAKYWTFEKYALNLLSEWWGSVPLRYNFNINPTEYTPEQSLLHGLKQTTMNHDLYLICFEKDKTRCHREIIKGLLQGMSPIEICANIHAHEDHLLLT